MRATETSITAKVHLANGSSIDLSDQVFSYSSLHSLEQIPSFSLTLPLLYRNKPITEVFRTGDLVEVGFNAQPDGRRFEFYTDMVGVVKRAGQDQSITENALSRQATMSGQMLTGWLGNETINYFLAAVLSDNLSAALGAQGVDDGFMNAVANKRLDKALAAFLERVFFRILGIQRPQGNARRLMGYVIKTLDGNGAFYQRWANFEGTAWSLLETYADRPIHEVYSTMLTAAEYAKMSGEKNTEVRSWGADKRIPALVVRPAPFPYATPGGGASLGDWSKLPLHDLTKEELMLEGASDNTADHSDADVVNVTYVHPSALGLDENVAKAYAPVVFSEPKYRRFGYRPLTFATQLWQNAPAQDSPAFFRALNWRIAGQHNRRDEMYGASFSLPRLAPWIRPGERVRYRAQLGDDTNILEGYVRTVQHVWSPGGERKTRLEVERALPLAVFKTPGWFAWGLDEFSIANKDDMANLFRSTLNGKIKQVNKAGN